MKDVVSIIGLNNFANVSDSILEHKIGDGGMCLSGEQKQCVALARALLKDSDIYIFNEAFSAIDKELKQDIATFLTSRLKNKTVIVVSHQLDAYDAFDAVYEIRNGGLNKIHCHE